jgi:hypothetical protein
MAVRGQSYQLDEEVNLRDCVFFSSRCHPTAISELLGSHDDSVRLHDRGEGRAMLGLGSRGRLSLGKPGRARAPVTPPAELGVWKLSWGAGSLIR